MKASIRFRILVPCICCAICTLVHTESAASDLTPADWANIRQQVYLKASNTDSQATQPGDGFGWSVAVSGDTVVVGAHREDSNAIGVNGNQANNAATNSGAVYVFVRDGTNWTQQAYLKASNAEAQDLFGINVAISGDTVVVGARNEDSAFSGVNDEQSNNSASNSGAAYVFVRTGTLWTQQAYLKASNTEAGDAFGDAVAISGDTIVIGAPDEDSGATGTNGDQADNSAPGCGAAYVFVRNGTTWTQQAYLKPSNTGNVRRFGHSLSASGDTLLVGAPQDDSNATGVNSTGGDYTATNSGAAYVFVRNGTTWSQQAYLKASNTEAFDLFGRSVAVSGDTAVVGAMQEDSNATGINGEQNNNGATSAGAAYVFVRNATAWTQQAYLKASNAEAFEGFGVSVAVSGDAIVVGADIEDSSATGVNGDQTDNSATNSGAGYVFVRNGTNWSQKAYVKASNTAPLPPGQLGDQFGSAVAISRDTLVIGAPGEDSNATGVNGDQTDNSASSAGAAYVFALPRRPERRVPDDYATIQAAVDAAVSGDTIRIAAGDYLEQVLIADKGELTLVGEPGAVIRATSSMSQTLVPQGDPDSSIPLIGIARGNVVLSGLTIDGNLLSASFSPNQLRGIYFLGAGGVVSNCTIRGFRWPALTRNTVANALHSYNAVSLGTPVVHIDIVNCTFTDNSWSIHLRGDPVSDPTTLRTTFNIEGNTITGVGPTASTFAHGIMLRHGAVGDVRGNVISGHSYNGTNNAHASGISALDGRASARTPPGYLLLPPVRYEGNRFFDNDQHMVLAAADDSEIVSNVFEQTGSGWRRWGAVAVSGTNILIANNTFTNVPIGIELFGGEQISGVFAGLASAPQIVGNKFCNVAEPIRAQPMAVGVHEHGNEIVCAAPAVRTLNVPGEYATIQGAINAALSGDTIRIGAGEYREQIFIANKGQLTLSGESGAVIHAMGGMTDTLRPFSWPNEVALLAIYRSDVVVTGLTFEGGRLGDPYGRFIGIYYLGAGGAVRGCTVRGFRGSGSTAADAIGIYSDNSMRTGSPAFTLEVSGSRFEDNELSIQVRGDPVSNPGLLRGTFTLAENTVIGWGPAALAIDGIAIRSGVTGALRGNIIRDHAYTGAGDAFSSGIAAHDGRASTRGYFEPLFPVYYEGNTFVNNDEHLVVIGGNDSRIVNNTFAGVGFGDPRWGALAVSGTNVTIANNNFADLPVGAVLFADDHFFSGWPRLPAAANVRFIDNWFCNVPAPLSPHPGVIGLAEQGTERCEVRPFAPRFQSLSNGNGAVEMTLRTWSGQSVVIETSTDLHEWVPVQTNGTLPTIVFRDGDMLGSDRRFYRAVWR